LKYIGIVVIGFAAIYSIYVFGAPWITMIIYNLFYVYLYFGVRVNSLCLIS